MMPNVDRAIQIAVEVHINQKDRNGNPYILHPIRVMMQVDSEDEQISAILHDVVEDSNLTLDDLKNEGFSETIIDTVNALSKRDGEIYDDYITRVSLNKTAIKIKLADLEDNMDLKRLNILTEEDKNRLAKYYKAWKKLSQFT